METATTNFLNARTRITLLEQGQCSVNSENYAVGSVVAISELGVFESIDGGQLHSITYVHVYWKLNSI